MKAPKQKSLKQLQKEVDGFNSLYNVGDEVNIKKTNGEIMITTVVSPAIILGGHSAVGWFKDISGCLSLDRIVGHK